MLPRDGLDEGSLLRRIIDASMLDPDHIETFLALFGGHLADTSRQLLRELANSGIEATVKAAVDRWEGRRRELGLRRDRINRTIERLEAQPHRSGDEEDELASLRASGRS
ncbi:MAG: hypothetical protein R2755_23660 [Acidimicrobiales bacterium]